METLDVSKMTDKELIERINVRSKAIDVTRKDVALMEADLANMRIELTRRKLDAFWQANEGLRLEVGDRLLVTEEAIAEISSKERNWPKGSIRAFTTSITFTVKHINANNSSITVRFLDSSETTLPLDIARRMRLAWLQAHGEAQP